MNKKKKKQFRKAQFGLDDTPKLPSGMTNTDGKFNWIQTGNETVPEMPYDIDPISQMQMNNEGDAAPQGKTLPFRYDANGNMVIQREEGTGNYKMNPYVEGFNYAATGVTGLANLIQDNKLNKKEQLQVLESLQQPYLENMEGQGLNNIPAYTQAGGYGKKYVIKRPYGGGPLTSEGAKEILRDGKVNGKKLSAKQKRYFGAIAGGAKPKKQTGGSSSTATSSNPATNRRLTPQEMQQWNRFLDYVKEQGYEGSPELNQKNKNLGSSLFDSFKKTNSDINIGYDIVPSVQNEMQLLRENTQSFLKRRNDPRAETVMSNISPVDGWFGSKTSQFRFPEQSTFSYKNGQLISATNDGLLNSSLQTTGVGGSNPGVNVPGQRTSRKAIPSGAVVEWVQDASGNKYQAYQDPQSGDYVQLQAGGNPYPLADDESGYTGGPVEAEAGEIVEGGNGQIFKISDDSNTHEEGGVKIGNVSRVLEDTSDQRKDRASKLLRISPEEMEALFGFKPKGSVSHAKAYELAKKHYDGQRTEANNKNKVIAKKPVIDKVSAKTAELNFKNIQDIPNDEDVYDALFMHQQEVKRINGIKDDGSMAKYGCAPMKTEKAQAGTESEGSVRAPRSRKPGEWYYDEGTQRWFKAGTVPSAAAKQQAQQSQSATQQTQQPDINTGGIQPYQGGRTATGRTTPMGNSNAFGFIGGLDAYKSAWQPLMDLSQYNTVQDAQQATYNYIVQNAPQEAQKIWQSQGLTQKGRDMMNPKSKMYDAAFAQTAAQVFTPDGRLKDPNKPLTNEQLAALTPAYSDNMLGIRSLTPAQMETAVTEPGSEVAQPRPPQPLDASVNVNPRFINQPNNRFFEQTYWDELAAPLMGLIEQRDPELYNPIQFNQLRYKMLDPTAALNANQADYNAAVSTLENMDTGTGAEAANLANLQASKYNANAQVMSQYDNQNTQIKNNEITYNTGVRDKQSVVDSQSRGTYHRNVQTARENQRQQRLKSIEDISRAIQLKRRQNRSGNLVLKFSPAFNQEGEYNGYQYAPVLPSDIGITSELPVVTSKGKTTTTKTTKIGNTVIKNTSITK